MEDPQRLSPRGRVKPQANGGRKMLHLSLISESMRGLLVIVRLRQVLRLDVNKKNTDFYKNFYIFTLHDTSSMIYLIKRKIK